MTAHISDNARKDQKIIVIGNGIAGNSAALTLKQLDPTCEVIILSEEHFPLYSACVLPHYLSGKLERQRVFIRNAVPDVQTKLGAPVEEIDVTGGRVFFSGHSLSYDQLILATGSKPVLPPLEGINKEGVFTFKSITDADQVINYPVAKAVVVGSGPVGVEISIALRSKGYEVYLIEMLDWILPKIFDEAPSHLLRTALEQQGINVFTGEKVVRILGNQKVAGITTDRRDIKCDMIIMVAGMRPEVALARQAGIKTGSTGGIKTDSYMVTSVENIFSCGDCVESKDLFTGIDTLSMLWQNARQQGEVAAQNCLGLFREYPGSLSTTGLEVDGLHAFSAGSTQSALESSGSEVQLVEKKSAGSYLRLVIQNGRLAGIQTIEKTNLTGRLLSIMRRREPVNEVLTRTGGLRWLDKCLHDIML
jgi:NADH oxidase (H2O2-forming)